MTPLRLCLLALCTSAAACTGRAGGGAPPGWLGEPGTGTGTSMPAAPAAGGPVPHTGPELFAYLRARRYAGFAHEPAVHPSAAEHGAGGVRVFFSPDLDRSLAEDRPEHPAAAAAVAELYGAGGKELTGWAASVKVSASSDAGLGWFWYEVHSTTDGAHPLASDLGVGLCTGCHAAGADYVLSPLAAE
ncbi:MAG: hypothetical protein HY744_11920 [Deltaproteobacteria bacterium]|nr:hypothetical protein [Deltaproteobacteria bacterium]